ncbi:MAG: hypothetical protein ACI8RD_001594 [Bacillariaceae sp.]|jgi:hypothetical protein
MTLILKIVESEMEVLSNCNLRLFWFSRRNKVLEPSRIYFVATSLICQQKNKKSQR